MNEKIGPILRRAREARDLSLEQVARETHMREHYLHALEEGNFDALPSDAQARGLTVASLIPGKSLNENWKFAAAAREPPRMTSFAAVAGSSNGSTMLRVW